MENFDFQNYRNSLAEEIKNESDKAKRREILAKAKTTEEYHAAKIIKIEKFNEALEAKQIEKLSAYAKENLEEYAAFDPELVELINTIGENKEKFYDETWPNVPDELIDRIFDFIEGKEDLDMIALLERANFDYESLLSNDADINDKARALLEAVLKASTYDQAVEDNKGKEIEFSGFENDSDISDAKEFIYKIFGQGLLDKCLISKVKYISDQVNVNISNTDYLLPIDIYKELEKQMPDVKKRKFRAESFVLWNTDPDFSKKFISTPIRFYSFYGEKIDKLNYLNYLPEEERMRQYKLGTIVHEVAHHIYDYLMDADMRKKWAELVDEAGTLTDYAKSYSNHKLKYDEFFTEAVRLRATSPNYLKTKFPDLDKFITDNFPEIAS